MEFDEQPKNNNEDFKRRQIEMSIVLFAIIGITIKADAWYWVCFGGYCLWKLVELIVAIVKALSD